MIGGRDSIIGVFKKFEKSDFLINKFDWVWRYKAVWAKCDNWKEEKLKEGVKLWWENKSNGEQSVYFDNINPHMIVVLNNRIKL